MSCLSGTLRTPAILVSCQQNRGYTMLSRIDEITGCGIFQQYQWDTSLPEFGRINIIYGSNGTGKSSLARALDRSCLQQPDTQANVTVSIKGENNNPLRFGDSSNKIFDKIYVFSDGYI